MLEGEAKYCKERYIRVVAIPIITIEGNTNICLKDGFVRNQLLPPSVEQKKDVPCLEHLMNRAEPSPINMLHWKIGEETKTTVHIQNHQHLQFKTEISKKEYYSGTVKLARLTTGGSSATAATTNQMTPS
jgi:hypothetical protein